MPKSHTTRNERRVWVITPDHRYFRGMTEMPESHLFWRVIDREFYQVGIDQTTTRLHIREGTHSVIDILDEANVFSSQKQAQDEADRRNKLTTGYYAHLAYQHIAEIKDLKDRINTPLLDKENRNIIESLIDREVKRRMKKNVDTSWLCAVVVCSVVCGITWLIAIINLIKVFQ